MKITIALNRKNALFAGSDGCAEHCTAIALIETCKLNDVEPSVEPMIEVAADRHIFGYPASSDVALPSTVIPGGSVPPVLVTAGHHSSAPSQARLKAS